VRCVLRGGAALRFHRRREPVLPDPADKLPVFSVTPLAGLEAAVGVTGLMVLGGLPDHQERGARR